MARRYGSGVGTATLDPGARAGGMRRIVATAYGCSFAVTVPEPLAGRAAAGLPCGWAYAQREPQRSWSLRPDGETGWVAISEHGVLGSGPDPARALDLLLGEVEAWVVGNAERVIAIRAGAVAWRGQVIVLPGLPGAGTTTLVTALVQAGATFFSDSYALLTPEGLVLPYARGRATPGAPVSGREVHQALPAAVVALLEHDPVVGWDVRPLSAGHTVLALVDHAVAVHSRPRVVMTHVLAAVRGTTGVTGTRGDSREAAHRILGTWADAG